MKKLSFIILASALFLCSYSQAQVTPAGILKKVILEPNKIGNEKVPKPKPSQRLDYTKKQRAYYKKRENAINKVGKKPYKSTPNLKQKKGTVIKQTNGFKKAVKTTRQ